jgi:hypothetical protein
MVPFDQTPTPGAGQCWHSKAFAAEDKDGRVDVIGVVQSSEYGLVVVEKLVYGPGGLSAVPVEEFLRRRTYKSTKGWK